MSEDIKKEGEGKIDEKKEVKPEEKKPEPKSVKSTKTKKRINWTRVGIVLVIIAFILIFIWPGKILLNTGSQKTTYYNLSYTLMFGEEEIDSFTGEIKEGALSSKIGFDNAILDSVLEEMVVGDEKQINVENAFGDCDPDKIYTESRIIQEDDRETELDRKLYITLEDFSLRFGEDPVLDKLYESGLDVLNYKVISVDGDNITISVETEVGALFPGPYFDSKVIAMTEETITMRHEGNDSVIPDTPFGDVSITFTADKVTWKIEPVVGEEIELENIPKARVVSFTEEEITLTDNHEYCGQDINVNLSLFNKEIRKSSITGGNIGYVDGAPVFQFYIMSYCPYGLQMLKAVLPVWREFAGTANIELRFVGYTMHGQDEEDENYRMICLREEQSDVLLDYLECFVEDGDYEGCLVQTGVDQAKLDDCIANRVEDYFAEDQALNEEYGVSGSPTIVINGETASVGRSPADVAQAICDAFQTKPSVCDLEFSTTQATTMFGTSGSSGSGTC